MSIVEIVSHIMYEKAKFHVALPLGKVTHGYELLMDNYTSVQKIG
ncbi:hypothetical protein [Candidatus Ichthyocystis sparus]|nr:hypothetical protein [Candidatus Ichthyocystis sparus]